MLDQSEKLFVAGPAEGDPQLRAMLASYLYRARGIRCMPEQILIGAGNEYLLLLLVQLLEKPCVAMESPTYVQAYEVLRHAGVRVYPVPMDGEGACVPLSGDCPADVVYVMPSHQFPTGTVMPLKRRQAFLDWAIREGRYIIEDDHDSEFRYVGKPIPSLQSRDMGERVIYLGTFSKSISPALRMSYMVLPRHLSRRFKEQFSFYASTVSVQQQRLVCRFMETGDFERHLNRMRRVYKAKHDFLLRELKARPWVRDKRRTCGTASVCGSDGGYGGGCDHHGSEKKGRAALRSGKLPHCGHFPGGRGGAARRSVGFAGETRDWGCIRKPRQRVARARLRRTFRGADCGGTRCIG